MAQPPAFQRGQRFTSYAALFAAAPFNASGADTEFDNVKATLDAILDNLASIQRDDGALANGSVHADALGASALLLFTEAGVTGAPKGDWVTATDYEVWDMVNDASYNQTYICVVAHTSGTFATDVSSGYWMPIGATASNVYHTPLTGMGTSNVQSALSVIWQQIYGIAGYAKKHALGDIAL